MALISFGVLFAWFIMTISLIALIMIFIPYFLLNIHLLVGFRGESRETDATIIQYAAPASNSDKTTHPQIPVLEYYNSFQGKNVIYRDEDAGLPLLPIGTNVRIQYTPKKARCVDGRYVSPNQYTLSGFVIPIVVCAVTACIGFLFLYISFV